MDQRFHGGHPPAGVGNLVASPDAEHGDRSEHAAEHDEHNGDDGAPAETPPVSSALALELGRLGAEALQLSSLVLAQALVLCVRYRLTSDGKQGHLRGSWFMTYG